MFTPPSDACQEKKTKWRMPRHSSLTFQTGNLSPTSAHTSRRESHGVCTPMPPVCRWQLTTMLHSTRYTRDSPPTSSIKTPPPGANDGTSSAGCKSPLTSKELKTLLRPYRFFLSASMPDFCTCKGIPRRSDQLSNTSAPLVKSSHQWGMTTPATTTWGN